LAIRTSTLDPVGMDGSPLAGRQTSRRGPFPTPVRGVWSSRPRHWSGQAIGRSTRRLRPKPRGRRPSTAALGAALAALRADEEQRARITEAFERMRNAAAWPDEGVTADLDFHRCVAAASGNPYIGMVVGFKRRGARISAARSPSVSGVAITVNSSLTRPSRRGFAKWRLCGRREDRSGPLPRRRKRGKGPGSATRAWWAS
jgi:hypothetical protein